MTLRQPLDTGFNFHVHTQLSIGAEVLDHTYKIMESHALGSPLWLIPKGAHQGVVKKILTRLYGKSTYNSIHVGDDWSEEELLSTTQAVAAGDFDCVVACGNASCIGYAKQVLLKTKGVHPISLIVVPFGTLDASECQGRFHTDTVTIESEDTVAVHAIFDGRLTRLATRKEVARTMCTSLLYICTSILDTPDPILMGFAESAFKHSHQTLELILCASKESSSWVDCTLSASAVLHAAGVCVDNRGISTIVSFAETLAIPTLADRHQTAAALLPYVMRYIGNTEPVLYKEIGKVLLGMDPVEFANAWVTLSEPKGTDRVIQQLCGDTHALLMNPRHIRELEPWLSLFPTQGGPV
jgi:alcohol dehydrogenase class IV